LRRLITPLQGVLDQAFFKRLAIDYAHYVTQNEIWVNQFLSELKIGYS
jgi:hypothetical protein